MKEALHTVKRIQQHKYFPILLLLQVMSLGVFAQAVPCNTTSAWVNGTYTNLTAQVNDDVPSVVPLCLGSVTNVGNLIDANLNNAATISITGIGCNATIGVRDADAADTYPAGTWAGYRIGTNGLLSGAAISSTVTITTWNNGVQQETYNAVTNLVGLDVNLLAGDGTANVGFTTTQPFDEVRITYQTLLGVLYTANVYHVVLKNYCAGATPVCNTITRLSGSAYPAAIVPNHTVLTGVTLGSILDAENVVSNSNTDSARINLPLGIVASGSIAVKDVFTIYPAGYFAGFEVSNSNLLGVGVLNNTTIRTYLNGVLQETKSANALTLDVNLLDGSGRQTVGFVATLPFNEVQFTINQTLGLNVGVTNVFNAVMKRHCAGPALACNTSTKLTQPTFPVNIDGNHTNIGGVACVGCSITNTGSLLDNIDSTYASITLTAGVAVNGNIAVKDEMTDYAAGTFAGYNILNNTLLGVNLLNNITITTYLNGTLAESKTGAGNLLSILNSSLIDSPKATVVGFVTTQAFDEVKFTINQTVGLNVGTTEVYGLVLEKFCAGPANLPCNQVRRLSGDVYPAVIQSERTGTTGIALGSVRDAENVVSNDANDYASIKLPLGIAATGSISVHDVLTDYPAGNYAGFVVESTTLLNLNILGSTTIRTYLNGNLQETQSGSNLIISAPLLPDTSRQTIGFVTTLPYDEIQFTISQTLGLNLDTTKVYAAVMKRHCASLPLFCNVPAVLIEPLYPVNINGNQTGITGAACVGCSITNVSNITDANLASYATISMTAGVLAQASVSVKQEVTNFPANTFAGFAIANVNLLNQVTITTYLDGVQAEQKSGAVDLLSVLPVLLEGPNAQVAGFVTTQPFDEVKLTVNQTVGVNVGETIVLFALAQRMCAGPVTPPCNVTTRLSGATYPAVVEASHTGTTGITPGIIKNAPNVVSASDSDYASIALPIGILATGSIAVRDALTDYPAGYYAGFDISNGGLLNLNILGSSTIRTYLNGTLQETKSGNNLIAGVNTLLDSSRQTIGFVTTMPFDEVQYTISQGVGLSLDTTKVYNAVIKRHCAGPALACNTATKITEPTFPVNVNGANSGINGVACVGCTISNTTGLLDNIDSTHARITLTAGVAVNGNIAVKDEMTDYAAGTFAGYNILNNTLLGVNLLNNITITTYLNGTLAESKTGAGNLLSILNSSLIDSPKATVVGFVTTQAFDEVKFTINQTVGLNVGTTEVYGLVLEKFCAGPANLPCNQVRRLSGDVYPAVIQSERTGTTGITLGLVSDAENVVSNDANDYASIKLPLGIAATGSISVHDVLTDYPAGNYAGFVVESTTLLNLNILGSTTIRTYLNGNLQETQSGSNLIISAPLLPDTSRQTIGFVTTLPYDEIQFTISQTLGLNLDTTKVYAAVMKRHCASFPIQCNVPAVLVEPLYPVNIDGNQTGFTGAACVGCSISNASNIIDLNLASYATINMTAGVLTQGSIAVKQEITDFPANTFAGFAIANVNLLGVNLLNQVTISTYLNGVLVESKSGAADLLSVLPVVLEGPGVQVAGFVSTQPFDEIKLSINQTVGVNVGETDVLLAIVQKLCPGPAVLPCNVTTRLSGATFPALVDEAHTGTTGIVLGSVQNAANAVSEDANDYATISLPVGILATGSLSVRDQLTDYPAGNFVGFDVQNNGLIGVGILNNSSITTYLNGTLQETKSGNNLIIGVNTLLDSSRQTIGFVTSMPYDEIQYTVNQPVGINLDTTRIYSAVMKRHCAAPALVCNTPTRMAEPMFPVNIDGNQTGINGVACVGCTINRTSALLDNIDTTFTEIKLTAGVVTAASIAAKDEMTDYNEPTFTGFRIANPNLLGAALLNQVSLTTFLNGVQQEVKSGSGQLALVNADLLNGNSTQVVGFVPNLPFDEIKLTLNQPVGVTLGTTEVYEVLIEKLCAGTLSCNNTYWLNNPDFPVFIDLEQTGITGGACAACAVTNTQNVLDDIDSSYATIKLIAGAAATGSIAVQDAISVYPIGSTVGFAIQDMNNLLQINLFNTLTVSTYLDGVLQESAANNNLLEIQLLNLVIDTTIAGVYNVGFKTTLPYDEVKLSVTSLVGTVNEIRVYGTFLDTRGASGGSLNCFRTDPDFAATYMNVPVTGNVNTNDIVPAGSTYGAAVPQPGNPAACVPVVATNGSYTFLCNTPGEYNYLVEVCAAPGNTPCYHEVLTITVLDQTLTTNPPTGNPDVATTLQGKPATIIPLDNDKCNNGIGCVLTVSGIITNPGHGAVVVNGNGTVTYTPAPAFVGKDTIRYAVCDNQAVAKCDTEYIFVTVLPAGAFNTTDGNDDYLTIVGTNTGSGNVLINDSDPEGDNHSVTPMNIANADGTLVLNADGSYVYTPADGFLGPVSFVYQVCDDQSPSACDLATLHILIKNAPDLSPSITVTPNVMHGLTTFNTTVRVTELNHEPTEGPITVRIPKDNRVSFTYNPAATMIGFTAVNNNVWSYDNSNPFFHIFTTNSVIPSGSFLTFGFVGQFDPQNSKGIYTISATINSGSGSEVRTDNNNDSESIDYFNN